MDEEAVDFKQMLNTMKAVEFRQKQQEKMIRTLFGQLKRHRQYSYHPHYKMTLYCKVIKGFMLSSMQLQSFADRLECVYINLLLRQHFDAFHQFKILAEEQREYKTREVELNVKRYGLRRFIYKARQQIELRMSQQSPRNEFSRVEEFKYKTGLNFYSKKEPQFNVSKQLGFNRLLEDSIKSAHSPFIATSQFQSKRKFAAVKQLPKMTALQSVTEQQEKGIELSQSTKKINIQRHISQQEDQKQKQQSLLTSQSKQKTQGNYSRRKAYDKNKILALISKATMLQIAQISSIIDEYREVFKHQSLISQERHLSECKNTLQRIANL